MQVIVEHFLDAGERDKAGNWGYYYEGDLFTFTADANPDIAVLRARIYTDEPTLASFLERRETLEMSPLTTDAVAYLCAAGATKIQFLEHGYHVWWSAE